VLVWSKLAGFSGSNEKTDLQALTGQSGEKGAATSSLEIDKRTKNKDPADPENRRGLVVMLSLVRLADSHA
jgi:hypothetical protein